MRKSSTPSKETEVSYRRGGGGEDFSRIRECAELLLKAGAQLEPLDRDFWTPLYLTVFDDNYPVAELLIQAGSNVNHRDRSDSTMLHSASASNSLHVAELFLKNGADVNAFDSHGLTPLNYAVKGQEMVDLIRRYGGKYAEEIWEEWRRKSER